MEMRLGPVPIVRWHLGDARLAEGRMSAPALSPDTLSALGVATGKIVAVLTRELQAVQEEYNLVSPAAVRVDPGAAAEISYIGGFPPQEIRTAVEAAAREIGNLAARMLSGAIAPYLPADQNQALLGIKNTSDQLVQALENQDMTSPPAGHQDQIQKYMDMHLADASSRVQAAEQGIVGAEAGSVPVLEPAEKISGMAIVAGVGVATGIGILLWAVLS
jgi:hypothetical protein